MSAEPAFSDADLAAAVAAISDPAAFDEAQDLVTRVAPSLQGVLADALEQGGWFGTAHEAAVAEATSATSHDERMRTVRTLLAEETRLGMFVGVAVGIALARQLRLGATEPGAPQRT